MNTCNMKRITLLLFLSILVPRLFAEISQFIHYGIKEGLTCSFVVDIAIDKHDRIWIATDNGLSLYDGIRFMTFNTYNSLLSDNGLNALLYDEVNDRLWVATKTKVSLVSCTDNRFMEIEETVCHGIQYLSRAADGGVWAGARGTGLCHYNPEGKIIKEYLPSELEGIPSSFISVYDDNGVLYIGSVFDGMSRVDLKKGEIRRFLHDDADDWSLPGNQVYDFCRDSFGRLWIATDHGLALMDEAKGTFTNFKHQNRNPNSLIADHIYAIEEPGDGKLWVCTDIGGISVLRLDELDTRHGGTASFYNIRATYDERGLSSSNIRKVARDRYGNYWIANYGSGISCIRHSGPLFRRMVQDGGTEYRSIRPQSVRGLFYDAETDELWTGVDNGVWVSDTSTGRFLRWYDLSPYLVRPNGKVYSICKHQNRIYLGIRDNGLLELNPTDNSIRRIDFGEQVDVNILWDDGEGQLWIGSQVGVYCYRMGMIERPALIAKQVNKASVFGFVKDAKERLWIACFGWGIILIDKEQKLITRIAESNGLCGDIVTSIIEDSDGNIWAATQRGVYIYPKGDYEHPQRISSNENLPDELIHCLIEDEQKNVWIGTDKGISCYRKDSKDLLNFSYDDGIPYGNIQHGSVAKDANGRIYMGTHNGTCVFSPADVLAVDSCSNICIREYHSTDNEHTFRFCVTDEAHRDLVEYAYRIHGLSDEWNQLGRSTSVTLRGLAPGHYTFEVKANLRNNVGHVGNVASVSFHIASPWWMSGWALACYTLLLCLAVLAYTRTYRRKVMRRSREEVVRRNNLDKMKLNEERLKFFTDITHELRTPLTLIVGPLEDLKADKGLPAFISKKISMIHTSAIQLLDLVNRILEFRKCENRQLTIQPVYLGELIEEVGLRFQELNRNEAVHVTVYVPQPDQQIAADRYVLQIILNNLISNALKYTPNGIIHVSLQWSETTATIKVRDTGYGIRKEDLPHIFECYYQSESKYQQPGTGIGLALVKELAELHQAEINVESREGEGTTFTIVLHRDKDYPEAIHQTSIPLNREREDVTEDVENGLNGSKNIILVVEDNKDIRQYIVNSLQDSYQTVEASDGLEGLEQAQKLLPDIIITDIMMPRMDGITLCKKVRNNMLTSHIPIVILTAKDTIDNQAEGYETGADVYLTKPFSARLLKGCVQRQLEQRKRLARHIAQCLPSPGKEDISSSDSNSYSYLNELDMQFINKLNELIQSNLSFKDFGIELLCNELNFSHSTLYRKTKALTGFSINEYIRKQRLIHAKELFSQSGYNVSEVAFACGFNDVGYFISCFKKEYNITPSAFLHSLQK